MFKKKISEYGIDYREVKNKREVTGQVEGEGKEAWSAGRGRGAGVRIQLEHGAEGI